MSHITRVKTKIRDLEILKKSLADLEIPFVSSEEQQEIVIKSFDKEDISGNFHLDIETGCSYHVGLLHDEKNDDYQFVADWWGIETYTGIKQEDFINKITRQYSYNTLMDKIKDRGYQLVDEDRDENNNIKLVLRKWN